MQSVRQVLLVFVLVFPWISVAPQQTKSEGKATPPSLAPPNIILITLDTIRSDRMGFLGSKRGLTPSLDALAKQSVAFTRAYAQVPLTTPSHAALLTGTYPQFNHVEVLRDPLGADLPYLPALLQLQGYHTAAFIGSMILDPASGAPGFDRGFDVYDAGFHLARPGEDRYHSEERRAEDVADRALAWLSQIVLENPQRPFLVWLHFFDAHDPYDPPKQFRERYKAAPYDGEIAYTDSVVGHVMEVLKRRGLFENSVIAIAADHGEAFGEHGETRHGLLLYDETIHVPMLLKLPAEKFAGERIDARVALAEVAPTLLEAVNVSVPSTMQARSLFPLIEDDSPDETKPTRNDELKPADRAVFSETEYAHRTLGWSELQSWRTGKYLYVHAPKRELYDQSTDPTAMKNLAPTSKAVADTLDAQLSTFRQETTGGNVSQTKVDPSQAESLHALGYLASDGGKENRIEKPQVDPKDKVEVVNQLQEALIALEAHRYDEAMAAVNKVVRDPDAFNAYLEFGTALVQHKRYQDAVPLLRKAVEKLPDSAAAHYQLGLALINTGQWESALPEMQAAVSLKPDSAALHFNLAAVNTRLKNTREAMAECEKALKIDPDHFDANLTYGKLLLQQGNNEAALTRLRHAVAVNPESAEAHYFLAMAFDKLGETESATRERQRVAELKAKASK